jgi:hypothetical protein
LERGIDLLKIFVDGCPQFGREVTEVDEAVDGVHGGALDVGGAEDGLVEVPVCVCVCVCVCVNKGVNEEEKRAGGEREIHTHTYSTYVMQ